MHQTIDKELVRQRFARGLAHYERTALVQKQTAVRLVDLIERSLRDTPPRIVFEVGCGTGLLTQEILARLVPGRLIANDITAECASRIKQLGSDYRHSQVNFIADDAERVDFPRADLIASSSTIQWFSDSASFLRRAVAALPPGGLLAVATFVEGNLYEIAATVGVSLTYESPQALILALGRDVDVLAQEEHAVPLMFDSPRAVLRHLQRCGVTGIRRTHWTRRELLAFEAEYNSRFVSDDKVVLTYRPFLFVARKKEIP